MFIGCTQTTSVVCYALLYDLFHSNKYYIVSWLAMCFNLIYLGLYLAQDTFSPIGTCLNLLLACHVPSESQAPFLCGLKCTKEIIVHISDNYETKR